MNKTISEIYDNLEAPFVWFDLDGVLADFNGRAKMLLKQAGLDNDLSKYQTNKKMKSLFWSVINKDEHFYYKLDPILPTLDLWNSIKSPKGVLSKIPRDPKGDHFDSKMRWVRKYLPDTNLTQIIFDESKGNYVNVAQSKISILIDDQQINVDSFNDAGGIGVLFDSNNIDDISEILKSCHVNL